MGAGLEVPRVHEVSKFIEQNQDLFPESVKNRLERIRLISRELRKERELAFSGAEDWIPLAEHTPEDAQRAIRWAQEIKEIVTQALQETGSINLP